MADELFIENLIQISSAADAYREKAQELVIRNAQNTDLISLLDSIPFGTDLLAGAHMYLQSGIDSFFSFRLLTLPNGAPTPGETSDNLFRLTNNGTAVLLRQSIECLVRAKWLLENKDRDQITQKGFAVCWSNSKERVKYERALNSTNVDIHLTNLKDLESLGFALKLMNPEEDGKKPSPKVGIRDATSLLKLIKLDLNLPPQVILELGNGFTNAEWVYRWLSGISHGMTWAHIFNEEIESQDVAFKQFDPDPKKFASSALFVLKIAGDVFRNLEGDFETQIRGF